MKGKKPHICTTQSSSVQPGFARSSSDGQQDMRFLAPQGDTMAQQHYARCQRGQFLPVAQGWLRFREGVLIWPTQ